MALLSLSADAIASIIFGILQLSVSLVALWQQRQLRLTQGKLYRDTNGDDKLISK